ncbi:helix-turn-helix transcriptional regulator [Ruegeria spongiae]|uniref:helix-turn-helix transcriptional regulator n=1 Tax=Ruegeria spongiae TaxID=2942209 RepID=UPI003570F073
MADVSSASSPSGLLTPDQVAHRLGISPSTLKRMRLRGEGPNAVKITRRTIRYQAAELDAWLNGKVASIENGRRVGHG